MRKNLITLAAALCMGIAGTAVAQSSSGSTGSSASTGGSTGGSSASASMATDTKAMKKQAEADYKAARELCKPMKGDEKKACEKDAKAAKTKADADVKRAEAAAKKSKQSS
jgi:hypothetical protein